jgi:nitrate reductase beta subunit
MMYLPRLCEHCLNPALRRRLPVGRDLQARGRRHRPDRPGQVPRLAHVRLGLPVQEDLLQLVEGKSEKCIFCYPRIEAGSRRSARKPASAASAISA